MDDESTIRKLFDRHNEGQEVTMTTNNHTNSPLPAAQLEPCEWHPVGGEWPIEYRMVLVATDRFQDSAPAINVGYMKYAAGDKDSPYFVCPGARSGFKPLSWCDCLGDDFAPPNWKMTQPRKD